MPERKLTDPERRRLTLAALSGAPFSSLAAEYGVSRSYVYKVRREALAKADEEGAFWDEVRKVAKRDAEPSVLRRQAKLKEDE